MYAKLFGHRSDRLGVISLPWLAQKAARHAGCIEEDEDLRVVGDGTSGPRGILLHVELGVLYKVNEAGHDAREFAPR